ncbi:MAG: hypothetical protein CMG41_01015 [Candidatus Marinimicrobia bacterium]|nr:hypothetical protein [Candidatus Neomarinimicrobiota bacterium]
MVNLRLHKIRVQAFLMIFALALVSFNCRNNKKTMYNYINSDSVDTKTLANGKRVYDNVCASCHMYGTAGAATMVDFKFWDKSAGKGLDIILNNVIDGYKGKFGVMPPKGNCLSCSDEDIRASVSYIFKEVLNNKTE